MDTTTLAARLPALVERSWRIWGARARAAPGPVGMNSVVVLVELPQHGDHVAKWVRARAAGALDRGSAVALEVEAAGLPAGAPLPTATGGLSCPLDDGRVALLRRVPGRPLTGATATEQEQMAAVLAHLHRVRRPVRRRDAYLHEPLGEARAVEPWVRPSVAAVLREHAARPALSWGLVHHDPAPEAFVLDEVSGSTGLLDWTGAGDGPLVFDVASAVMYLGGRARAGAFLDAYAARVPPALAEEVGAHLDALLRFRGAVQAAYFSGRVDEDDLTGVSGAVDNLVGLHHARRMLLEAGLPEAADEASGPTRVLRPLRADDLDAAVAVQEEGAVTALAHVFPQERHPFPRSAVRDRWARELADPGTDCFVVGLAGRVQGFAAARGDELLHLGTARATWGSGLARRAHDELVEHLRRAGVRHARLRVFEDNVHARRFYEHRGWTPTGDRTRSAFAPHPVLLGYVRRLEP